jgi:hypothetical protein
MIGRALRAAVCVLAVVGWPVPWSARAQDAAVGTYCLVGVREVGSCVRLSAGGKFEYFLAYGAYDENAEGTWRSEGREIVVDSLPYDKRPTFSFKRMQRGDTDAFDVVVERAGGGRLTMIDVSVICDGRTKRAGATGAEGFKVDCTTAPTEVLLGLRMYGLAPQAINVAGHAGNDKVYVFEFDPGDLGRKKFVAQRFRFKTNDTLVMVFAGSPIAELNGRSFEYVRSR